MTYKEVNDRLTKVQTALNKLKSGKIDLAPVKTQAQLEIIKESLQKKLITLKEREQTMFVKTKGGDDEVVTLDKKEADKLKKDTDIIGIKTAKGKTIKEEEITVEQNQEIAKKVGKALANSLRKVGDELDTMKGKRSKKNIAEITGIPLKAVNAVYKKGEGAYYSSGSRPNQSPQSWARGRLYAYIMGGNKVRVVDKDITEKYKVKFKIPTEK